MRERLPPTEMAGYAMAPPGPLLSPSKLDLWSLLSSEEPFEEEWLNEAGYPLRTFFELYGVRKVFIHAARGGSVGPEEACHSSLVSPRNVGLTFAGCLVILPWEAASRIPYLKQTAVPRTDVVLIQEVAQLSCSSSMGKRMVIYDICRSIQYFQGVLGEADKAWAWVDFERAARDLHEVLMSWSGVRYHHHDAAFYDFLGIGPPRGWSDEKW